MGSWDISVCSSCSLNPGLLTSFLLEVGLPPPPPSTPALKALLHRHQSTHQNTKPCCVPYHWLWSCLLLWSTEPATILMTAKAMLGRLLMLYLIKQPGSGHFLSHCSRGGGNIPWQQTPQWGFFPAPEHPSPDCLLPPTALCSQEDQEPLSISEHTVSTNSSCATWTNQVPPDIQTARKTSQKSHRDCWTYWTFLHSNQKLC